MLRGEEVRCVSDYDLFGINIKGKEGCYIKFDKFNKKHLIWFPCNGEWAELSQDQFEPTNEPGLIPEKYKNFISRIKTLEYSY